MKKVLILFTIIALSPPLFSKTNSSVISNVKSVTTDASQAITKMEYWFDLDTSARNIQIIPQLDNFNWVDSLDVSEVSNGLHALHIRFATDANLWSSVSSTFFLKSGLNTSFQPELKSMEYWVDNNSASRMLENISSNQNYQWLDSLEMNSLGDGLHVGHVRFSDKNGKWSSIISSFFLKRKVTNTHLPEVTRLEYWLDGNSTTRIQQNILSTQKYQWLDSLDLSSLGNGLHAGHVRYCDNAGQWSSVVTSFFLKRNNEILIQPVITQMEYWLDGKSTSRTKQNISNSVNYQWLDSIDMSSVSNGLHVGHVRFSDGEGNWSSVVSSYFMKSGSEIITNPVLKNMEYWIDGNLAEKVQQPFDINKIYHLQDSLPAENLTNGLHTFSVRFADANGKWSSVQSSYFQLRNVEIKNNRISNYRYWFDIEPYYRPNVSSDGQFSKVNITDSLDVAQLPMGNQVMYFQFRDQTGKWSSVLTDTISQNDIPKINFTADNQQLCDSGVVNFGNDSLFVERMEWKFGDSAITDGFNPYHNYTNIGTYDVSATVWFKGTSDSLVYVQPAFVRVNPSARTSTDNSIVYGDSIQFGGVWHKLPGQFTLNLQTQTGCDSTSILNLALTKAQLMVLVNDTTREFNAENPVSRLSYSGFMFNETPAVLDVLPNTSTIAIKTSPVGEYDVFVSGGSDDHYSFVYQAGKLIVLEPNGLTDLETFNIMLYPNPVSTYLSVRSDMAVMKHITILDVNGRIMLYKECIGSPTEYIKTDGLAKGLYIISIVTDKGKTIGKIIKE